VDIIVTDNISPTYIPGNLVWLSVTMDDVSLHGMYYRDLLVHKWLQAAQYVLNNRQDLQLSWPSIIQFERDGKWVMELKSEVLAREVVQSTPQGD
jgi:hypothetical protein